MSETPREQITAAVLAGGRARRMGGEDKGLVRLNGREMIAYALEALTPQVARIVINANRNPAHYGRFGWPVVADRLGDYSGPLAGMASVMAEAQTPYVLSVPCDSPLLPVDLAGRLFAALTRERAQIAVAHDGARMQPVFALLERGLLPSLEAYLHAGERKIDRWYAQQRLVEVDFSDCADAFINVNTPEERAALAAQLAATPTPS